VTGMLVPLVAGNTLRVVQFIPTTLGHVSVRFKPLSKGPVGPDSYFHVTLRLSKFTCLGSLSGYCSSPHCPRNWSQAVGVEGSDGVKVPLLDDEGEKI
jgi:hypothetical protein